MSRPNYNQVMNLHTVCHQPWKARRYTTIVDVVELVAAELVVEDDGCADVVELDAGVEDGELVVLNTVVEELAYELVELEVYGELVELEVYGELVELEVYGELVELDVYGELVLLVLEDFEYEALVVLELVYGEDVLIE